MNLLHQTVTKLYPFGTQVHFPVFRYLLLYFFPGIYSWTFHKGQKLIQPDSTGLQFQSSHGKWNLRAFYMHEMKAYSAPLFHLHQIINCCWTKQNKACTVAINYSDMLWTLSESQRALEESKAVIFHGCFSDDITLCYSVIPVKLYSVKPCI